MHLINLRLVLDMLRGKPEKGDQKKYYGDILVENFSAFGVLLLSLFLTGLGWQYTTKAVERDAKLNFERQVSEAKDSLHSRIQTYVNALRASQGLFASSERVERDEWRAFVEAFNLQNLYPGINGIGFIRYVPNSKKADYEQQVRRDTRVDKTGYPDFAIKPAGVRPAYFVIEYIEPLQLNRPAFGLDIGYEPVRRASVERARDTGKPAATGRIILAQDATKQPGLLILLPVYRNGILHSTVEERRRALLGFIYAPFRAEDLIEEALSNANKQDLDLEVYSRKDLMYDSDNVQQAFDPKFHPLLRQITTLDVAGEPWQLYFTSYSSLRASSDKTPILVLSGGTLISLLLFGILSSLTSSRRRALRLATSMTADLRESENQLRDFFDNANDLIQSVSPNGRFMFVNRAWQETLGYSEEEIKLFSLFDILHPDSRQHCMEALKAVQAGETSYALEATFMTKDSMAITVEGSVNCQFEDGLPKLIRGIFRDITERKQVEEQVNLFQTLMLAIGECRDFDEALAVILRTVCQTKGWNYGEAWIPCSKKTVLECSSAWYGHTDGLSRGDLPRLDKFRRLSKEFTFAPGIGLPGRVWSSQLPEWQQDVSQESEITFRRGQIAMNCGLRAGLGIPLLVNEQMLAVLVFFKFESCKEDIRLVESISAVATQLGSVIQRKRMEQVLRESEERFKVFMNNSPAVAFIKDEVGRYAYVNEPFERFFEIKLANVLGKTDFDLWSEEIALQLHKNDTRVMSADKTVEIIETVPTPDGCYHYWLSFKFPFKDFSGQRFLAGMAIDITERKHNEAALQQANEKLTIWVNELEQRNREIALLSEISDFLQACLTVEEAYTAIAQLVQPLFPQTCGGIFLISASKKLVEAVATWGSPPLPTQEVFTPDDCWALRRGRVHRLENTHSGLICKHLHRESLPTESLCVPMMAQGEALGMLYLSTQELGRLTETKQLLAVTVAEHIALALANLKLRDSLKSQSIRDPLTGLFNRRYMEESLEREIHRCKRKQLPLSIIMIDVDHFKRFNDTHGHEAGDAVLRELGMFLRSHIRESDIACRYGGEELTLILPEASVEVVWRRAEQLRQGVKHLQVQHNRQPLGSITLSLGVACLPGHGLTAEALIRAADAALYCAKKEGRDAVRLAA